MARVLAVVVVAAVARVLATAATAAAYNQSYNCESFAGQPTCHLTAGSWFTITNVGATNYTTYGDICAGYGTLSGSYRCVSNAWTILLCTYTGGVYQYGVSETAYGDSGNLAGHEDNSSTCN